MKIKYKNGHVGFANENAAAILIKKGEAKAVKESKEEPKPDQAPTQGAS